MPWSPFGHRQSPRWCGGPAPAPPPWPLLSMHIPPWYWFSVTTGVAGEPVALLRELSDAGVVGVSVASLLKLSTAGVADFSVGTESVRASVASRSLSGVLPSDLQAVAKSSVINAKRKRRAKTKLVIGNFGRLKSIFSKSKFGLPQAIIELQMRYVGIPAVSPLGSYAPVYDGFFGYLPRL